MRLWVPCARASLRATKLRPLFHTRESLVRSQLRPSPRRVRIGVAPDACGTAACGSAGASATCSTSTGSRTTRCAGRARARRRALAERDWRAREQRLVALIARDATGEPVKPLEQPLRNLPGPRDLDLEVRAPASAATRASSAVTAAGSPANWRANDRSRSAIGFGISSMGIRIVADAEDGPGTSGPRATVVRPCRRSGTHSTTARRR